MAAVPSVFASPRRLLRRPPITELLFYKFRDGSGPLAPLGDVTN
jgi:hypothetical protein